MALLQQGSRCRNRRRQGTALIEFAIVMTILIPMFFGMVIFGISAGRAIEATQFTRDMGHMYSSGVDFSTTASQSLMTTLAQNLDVSASGTGVVIFSQIKKVYQSDCDAQSMSTCPNLNSFVFMQRLVKGNSAVRPSNYGTPTASYINSQGNIAPSDYLTQASLVATGATVLPVVPAGNSVWVVESYFGIPGLAFLSPIGISVTGVYSVSYF
jgi:Flp pilus assembly protein TadG